MILVTGATGFLGSVLTRQLVEAGAAVRVLRRPTSALDLLGPAAARVEHAMGDVTDPESVRAAMAGVRAVYHTAAFVGFGGARDRARLRAVNVGGTAVVADAAREAGVGRLVHTSSIAALGRAERPDAAELDEQAIWRPSKANTAYAESKYLAELEVQRAVAEGLDAVLGNPSVIFGPGRPGEGTMQIVEQVRRRRLPAAPAGGTSVVDVEDVAAGLRAAHARGAPGERYVLAGENLAWAEILATLAEALGVPPPRRVLPPHAALALATAAEATGALTRTRPLLTRETARTSGRTYRYANARARAELGATFRPFRETAARIAAALQTQPGAPPR